MITCSSHCIAIVKAMVLATYNSVNNLFAQKAVSWFSAYATVRQYGQKGFEYLSPARGATYDSWMSYCPVPLHMRERNGKL